MKEAAEGIAEWPEVDPDTFSRFWQFTYTGDYTGAEPTEVPPTPPSTPPTPTAAEPATDTRQSLDSNVADISSESLSHLPKIQRRKQLQKLMRDQENLMDQGHLMDHSEEFLSHARLYVLADYYDMPELIQLRIQKLDKSLEGFLTKSPRNEKQNCKATEDIVAVLEYCYSNTADKGSSRDELRQLLARHVARAAQKMWAHPVFQSVLEQYGEMARDIIGYLLESST